MKYLTYHTHTKKTTNDIKLSADIDPLQLEAGKKT